MCVCVCVRACVCVCVSQLRNLVQDLGQDQDIAAKFHSILAQNLDHDLVISFQDHAPLTQDPCPGSCNLDPRSWPGSCYLVP